MIETYLQNHPRTGPFCKPFAKVHDILVTEVIINYQTRLHALFFGQIMAKIF